MFLVRTKLVENSVKVSDFSLQYHGENWTIGEKE